MAIHQEVGFEATGERVYRFPAVEQQLRNRNLSRGQEESVDDLLAAVESLRQIVCELLLRNQILRLALDRAGETVTTSSIAGFSST